MGVVLRAHDEVLGRVVALKVLRSQDCEPKARARLVHEAQVVAKLRHDNVVTLHAVVNPPDDAPFLVMEYVEGGSLAALIKSQGRLDPRRAATIVAEAADGLETAHAAGLIHRDIKPSNILVDAVSGRAKITDFGLARWTEQSSGLTQDSAIAGTPTHMSPEQARGGKELDRRCDVYSLGVTLYEALAGTVPFHGAPDMVFQQVLTEEPLPVRRLNDSVPRDLETICMKAMAKEPGRRYQTAHELAEDSPLAARRADPRPASWAIRTKLALVPAPASGCRTGARLAAGGGRWSGRHILEMGGDRLRAPASGSRARPRRRNFREVREAVDTYLTQVSENPALKEQNLEPLRRELLRTARDFYERFVQQDPDDPNLQAELGRAYARLGQITSVLESSPKALEHYQKMGAIFERLHEADPDNPIYHQELAESYLRQGDSLRTGAGPAAQAQAAFERSRRLFEDLVRAHPREPAHQHGLARSLRSLGHFSIFSMTDHAHAEEALTAAREIYNRLPASYTTQPRVQFDRALVLSNLAKLYSHTDRPEQHRSASEAAIAIFEPMVRTQPGNPDFMYYLADSLSELGDSYRRLAQPELARTTLEKALKASEELARSHPANGYHQHLVADIAYSLASLCYHEQQQPEHVRVLLQKALDIEQDLVVRFPAVAEYMFYLNNLLRDLRDWFGDTARLNAICDHFTFLIKEYEAQFPPDKRDHVRLDRYYVQRGQARFLLGRFADARADFKQVAWLELESGAAASVHAQQREYDEAEKAAITFAQMDSGSGAGLYHAAQLGAGIAAVVRNDQSLPVARREELAEKYSRGAVEWLRKAQSCKYLSTPSTRFLLADDRELDPLRSLNDFQALVAQKNAPPSTGK